MAIIGIDFDGTCVTHEFPNIGNSIGAERVLMRLVNAGHKLVLFTMRSDVDNPTSENYDIHASGGMYSTDAVNWFTKKGIPLWGVNENPEQNTWTTSPKAYCHLYIDDAALGCPLITNNGQRPYVNWFEVECMLIEKGIL